MAVAPLLPSSSEPEGFSEWIAAVSAALDALDADALRSTMVLADPSNDMIAVVTVEGDGSATPGWPNRLELYFTPQGGSPRLVQWWNEFLEQRLKPSSINRVAWRLFAAEDATEWGNRSVDDPIWEVMDDPVTRTSLATINKNGDFTTGGEVNGIPFRGLLQPEESPTEVGVYLRIVESS